MLRRDFARNLLAATAVPAFAAARSAAAAAPEPEHRRRPDLPPGGSLTDIPGIQVGHATLTQRPTGCTVILCEQGAVAGVDVRGAAPGTRETDLLNPLNAVDRVNAIVLSGGSAYGLDTASGVMRFLEEHHAGFPIGERGVVPIVPAAILMDLGFGDFHIRPTADTGYRACLAATTGAVPEGNVGAGAGATVGKLFGMANAMKSGLGTASVTLGNTGISVAALAAVNAVGDVVHPVTGEILAGSRGPNSDGSSSPFRNSTAAILRGEHVLLPIRDGARTAANTTLGVVATNAPFTKTQMTKIAQMAHDGLARAIRPVHTMYDGDTVFALSTGAAAEADLSAIGAVAAVVLERAIVRAVMLATGLPQFNLPAFRDL
jgi:L-aminopeptidase/D-esterase-like protein